VPAAAREPDLARLSVAGDERPFPPGAYPVVVVGTGPGGLQASYCLRRRGIEHALLSADEGPGGMFRRFPLLQRLITWSKPYALEDPATPAYERYDWNSLLVEDEDEPLRVSSFMHGPTYFPGRDEMEAALAAFAERHGVVARYGCGWESTERTEDGVLLHTSDGDYAARVAIFCVGAANPWKPSLPGLEDVPHYADVGDVTKFAGRRVFVIGKRNGAFELADGLLAQASQVVLASPRPANLSILTRSTAGARARYLQVYEDAVLGGGSYVIDAALERVERRHDGWRVFLEGTTRPGPMTFAMDDVIAATGWHVPMLDLPDLGVRTFHSGRLPALTPYWESATVPGVYFGGTTTMGAVGLKKHGIPSSSAAVHGFRYNVEVLVATMAERHFGVTRPRHAADPEELPSVLAGVVTSSGALWNQQAYLAEVWERTDAEGPVHTGLQPLQAFVDNDGGPDAAAATIETTGDGSIRPVLYVRRGGALEEHPLEEHPLFDYRGPRYVLEIARIVKGALT
jgi:thioredoxin reductase